MRRNAADKLQTLGEAGVDEAAVVGQLANLLLVEHLRAVVPGARDPVIVNAPGQFDVGRRQLNGFGGQTQFLLRHFYKSGPVGKRVFCGFAVHGQKLPDQCGVVFDRV